MQLTLITNSDNTQIVQYKIARIIFAETDAASLQIVEAMASMINNVHIRFNKSFDAIAQDSNLFESLNPKSSRHNLLNVSSDNRKFQMCLRVVKTMMRGNLDDSVFGATKFHRTDVMPEWAISRGYISECENILFYL